jgi:hypothetical protein
MTRITRDTSSECESASGLPLAFAAAEHVPAGALEVCLHHFNDAGSWQAQVVLMLTELEDGGQGVPPSNDEVAFVLRKVGHVDGKLMK